MMAEALAHIIMLVMKTKSMTCPCPGFKDGTPAWCTVMKAANVGVTCLSQEGQHILKLSDGTYGLLWHVWEPPMRCEAIIPLQGREG